jgi:hypothetical protein
MRQGDLKGTIACLAVLCSLFAGTCAAQAGKVEEAGPPDSAIPESVRRALDTKGYRVVLDDGSAACEIWLRKSVPVQAKRDVPGALYWQLAESTLVGVISFPQAATDYRGEAVKAGVYTLRYELLPNDGNHMGVAPNRDFLMLIPAASDPDPDAKFDFQQLVNLSRKATGTPHPGPLSLVQAGSGAAAVSKDDSDHWVFSAELKLESGEEMPFSLVVKGTAPQ